MNDIDGVSYCEVCNYFEGAFGCVDGACRKPSEPQKALYMGLAAAYPDVPVLAPAECVPSAPASPPPPTENARAGAGFEYPTGNASIDAAYAAGRARGIEEERKRCEGIARDQAEQRQLNAKRFEGRDAYRDDMNEELVLAAECAAIADAIAKETDRG